MKSNIENHLKSISVIQLGLTHEVLPPLSTLSESVQPLASSSASTSMQVPLHIPLCSPFFQA